LATLLLLTALFVGRACYFRHDICFLADRSPARWILYPSPTYVSCHPGVPLEAVFRRSFSLASVPAAAQLRLRVFRTATIQLNGKAIPAKFDAEHWKQEFRFDVTQLLRAGENDLTVTVSNTSGPPALWLAISCPENVLVSDTSWEASLAGATWLPTALAADPVPFRDVDRDGTAEQVIPSLEKVWPMWLMFAAASAAMLFFGHRWLAGDKARGLDRPEVPPVRPAAPPATARRGKKRRRSAPRAGSVAPPQAAGPARSAPRPSVIRSFVEPPGPQGRWVGLTRVLFILIALFWAAMVLHNSPYLPPNRGFDADGHLAYINHFRTTWSVPLPGQSWGLQHPPLYYMVGGVLLRMVGCAADTPRGIFTIRLLNLMLALGNIAAILACLRLIFPEHPRRWVLGLLVAGFLPVYLYFYQYPLNHCLATTLASLAIYFTLRILCISGAGMRDYAFLGLALGLAMLTIVTASVLVVPVGVALVAKLYADRAQIRWTQGVLRLVVLADIVVVVCGWYYLYVWVNLGTPIVGNTGSGIGAPWAWWQDPGFRTGSDYLRFGLSLRSPLYSAWYSVGDGFYSTLWGDGSYGGMASIEARPPWSYDYLVAGMPLALLPTAAILLAGGVMIFGFLRQPTIVWTFLLGVAFSFALFVIYCTLLVPYYSALKASYGLAGSVPLCLLAALGFDLLAGPRRWLRGVIFTILGVWVLNTAVSYWIFPAAAETRRSVAGQLATAGDLVAASRTLEQLLAEHPEETNDRVLLARFYQQRNLLDRARHVLDVPSGRRDSGSRHVLLGILWANAKRRNVARDEFQKAMKLAPNDWDAARGYAETLAGSPDVRIAIDAWRNVLRANPYDRVCHVELERLYRIVGDAPSARRHLEYIHALDSWGKQKNSRRF